MDDTIKTILIKFGIKDIVNYTELPSKESYRKIIIKSDSKYILKEFKYIDEEIIKFITTIQEYLIHKKVSVPKIYKTESGMAYLQQKESYWTLNEFIGEGKSYENHSLNKDEIYDAGKLLGIVHKELGSINISTHKFTINLYTVESALEKMIELEEYYVNINDVEYSNILDYRYNELLKFSNDKFELISKLPMQMIHGDFHKGNLVYDKNTKSIMLIDFENVCVFYKTQELLKAATFLCFDSKESILNIVNNIMTFISGYLSVNSISEIEKKYMLDLFYYSSLTSLYGLFIGQNEGAEKNQELREYVLYKFDMLKWIKANYHHLSERINGILK